MVLERKTYGNRTQYLCYWNTKPKVLQRLYINMKDSDAGFVDMIINKTGNIITISPVLIKIYLLSLLMKIAQRYTGNAKNADK